MKRFKEFEKDAPKTAKKQWLKYPIGGRYLIAIDGGKHRYGFGLYMGGGSDSEPTFQIANTFASKKECIAYATALLLQSCEEEN